MAGGRAEPFAFSLAAMIAVGLGVAEGAVCSGGGTAPPGRPHSGQGNRAFLFESASLPRRYTTNAAAAMATAAAAATTEQQHPPTQRHPSSSPFLPPPFAIPRRRGSATTWW